MRRGLRTTEAFRARLQSVADILGCQMSDVVMRCLKFAKNHSFDAVAITPEIKLATPETTVPVSYEIPDDWQHVNADTVRRAISWALDSTESMRGHKSKIKLDKRTQDEIDRLKALQKNANKIMAGHYVSMEE